MKFTVTIPLTLIAFTLLGQPKEWDRAAIKKNKVKEIKIVVEAPKTNPQRPSMLWRQASFDNQGRLSESVCKDCLYESHGRGPEDLTRRYTYEHGRIVRIDEFGFDKRTIFYQYDTLENKALKITQNERNERTGISLEVFDKLARLILSLDIHFDRSYPVGDSVFQIHFDRTTWVYNGLETLEQRYQSEDLIDFGRHIDKSSFYIFQTSNNIKEVENTLMKIDLGFLKPWQKTRTLKGKTKISEYNVETRKETTFQLNRNGLIELEEREVGNEMWILIYEYGFW